MRHNPLRRLRKVRTLCFCLLISARLLAAQSPKPSHERADQPANSRLPEVHLDGHYFVRDGKRVIPVGAHWVPAKVLGTPSDVGPGPGTGARDSQPCSGLYDRELASRGAKRGDAARLRGPRSSPWRPPDAKFFRPSLLWMERQLFGVGFSVLLFLVHLAVHAIQ
jgi:hypothetical protein